MSFLHGLGRFGLCLYWAVSAYFAFLGVIILVDIYQPPNLPDVKYCPDNVRKCIWDKYYGPTDFPPEFWDEECKWLQCRQALTLLDATCPEVADWVRDRRSRGLLLWRPVDGCTIAWYLPVTEQLGINDDFFWYGHARRAAILAHEFRHSRQKVLRHLEWGLAALLQVDRTDLVEEEAQAFERKVYDAIMHHN